MFIVLRGTAFMYIIILAQKIQSLVTDLHVVDKKTKTNVFFKIRRVQTFKMNYNEQSHLYHDVFATDPEIFKGKFTDRLQ